MEWRLTYCLSTSRSSPSTIFFTFLVSWWVLMSFREPMALALLLTVSFTHSRRETIVIAIPGAASGGRTA